MNDFLLQLFDTGEIVVPRHVDMDDNAIAGCLNEAEAVWKQNWPGTAPPFVQPVAQKAAQVLLHLCQAVVYRELDEVHVAEQLRSIALVPRDDAGVHYSADLLFRFLPQVHQRLRRVSSDDPLLMIVTAVGRDWPLSAVGIPDCLPDALPDCFQNTGLLHVFVDRIMAANDQQRSELPAVKQAIKLALGPHEWLATHVPSVVTTDQDLLS
ncbi:MAG: hypothetical protein R3C59_15520 [Planctomycetaceae bacterium]